MDPQWHQPGALQRRPLPDDRLCGPKVWGKTFTVGDLNYRHLAQDQAIARLIRIKFIDRVRLPLDASRRAGAQIYNTAAQDAPVWRLFTGLAEVWARREEGVAYERPDRSSAWFSCAHPVMAQNLNGSIGRLAFFAAISSWPYRHFWLDRRPELQDAIKIFADAGLIKEVKKTNDGQYCLWLITSSSLWEAAVVFGTYYRELADRHGFHNTTHLPRLLEWPYPYSSIPSQATFAANNHVKDMRV